VIAKSLGYYRIIEKIGAGGMVEVWKARDSRLGRSVAIKKARGEEVKEPGRRKKRPERVSGKRLFLHYIVGTSQ
jgi:serine/threonine protein kinase